MVLFYLKVFLSHLSVEKGVNIVELKKRVETDPTLLQVDIAVVPNLLKGNWEPYKSSQSDSKGTVVLLP